MTRGSGGTAERSRLPTGWSETAWGRSVTTPGPPLRVTARPPAWPWPRGMLAQADSQVIDGLASIRVPTLVLVGGRDEAFLGAAEYVAAKIPGAHKVVIPDADHMCNIDQPGLFNEAVLAFLDSLP